MLSLAVYFASDLKTDEALSAVVDVARHAPVAGTRATAVWAVRNFKQAAATDLLRELLKDPDRDVRWAAVSGLAWKRDPAAVDLLLGVFNDPGNPTATTQFTVSAIFRATRG